jgi:hypothetical protein
MKTLLLISLFLFGRAQAIEPMEKSIDISYWYTTQHKQYFGKAITHGFMIAKNYKWKVVNAFNTTSTGYFAFGHNSKMEGNTSDFEYKYSNYQLAVKQTVNYTNKSNYKFSMGIGIGYGRQSLTSLKTNPFLKDGDEITSEGVLYDLSFKFEFRQFKKWIPFISYGYVNFKTTANTLPNGVLLTDITANEREDIDLSYKYYYFGFRKLL